jgi:hypothetical protein
MSSAQLVTKQDLQEAVKAIQSHTENYVDYAVKVLKKSNEEYTEGAVTSILDALEHYVTKEEFNELGKKVQRLSSN